MGSYFTIQYFFHPSIKTCLFWQNLEIFYHQGIPSSMVLRYSVQCNRDYYGPQCTTYCIARDDSRGHYTCNLQTGSKVCRSGWYGSDCLTYCIPRDDDVNGHYTCHPTSGSKVMYKADMSRSNSHKKSVTDGCRFIKGVSVGSKCSWTKAV